jgi:DNA primase
LGGGSTFEDKRDMIRTAMAFVSKISDRKEKELFIKRIAEKTGLNEALLIKEAYGNEKKQEGRPGKTSPPVNVHHDVVELNLIQLMLEYPQKIMQVENEHILDYFLQPEIRNLGNKIIDAYKLLGFVDVALVLSDGEHTALRERLYQLMIKELPTADVILEKIFADNVKQIKRKWYREQHRQIKIKLSKAQEIGNEDLMNQLLHEKQKVMIREKELH